MVSLAVCSATLCTLAAGFDGMEAYLTGEAEDPRPLKRRIPASEETGIADSVARAGLEPATPRL